MKHLKKLSMITLILAAMSASVFAARMSTDTRVNDVPAVEQAKISLTQAISTAESHVKGTAYKAKFKQSRLSAIYDVEVVQGNQVFDVKIDAVKGDVLSSVVDNAEHDSDD